MVLKTLKPFPYCLNFVEAGKQKILLFILGSDYSPQASVARQTNNSSNKSKFDYISMTCWPLSLHKIVSDKPARFNLHIFLKSS